MKTMFKLFAMLAVIVQISCASTSSTQNEKASLYGIYPKVKNLNTAVFTPDGKYLLMGSYKDNSSIIKVDTRTGKRIQTFSPVKNKGFRKIIISKDGQQLFAYNLSTEKDSNHYIFDVETGQVLHTLPAQTWRSYFATDNGFNTVSFYSDIIHIRETISDKIIKSKKIPEIMSLFKHKSYWHGINDTGTKCYVYSYVQENRPHTWMLFVIDLEEDEEEGSLFTIYSNVSQVENISTVTISPDGNYLALGTTEEIQPREVTEALAKSRKVQEILRSRESIESKAISLFSLGFVNHYRRDGDYGILNDVSKGFDFKRHGKVTIYDLNNAKPVASKWFELRRRLVVGTPGDYNYSNHENTQIRNLVFSPDSKTLAGISTCWALFLTRKEQNNTWKWTGNPSFQDKKSKAFYYNEPSTPYREKGLGWSPYDDYKGKVYCFDPEGKYLLCTYGNREYFTFDDTIIHQIFIVNTEF